MRTYIAAAAFALFFPSLASAQVLSQIAGLFNILVGLMLVAAFLLFFGGVAMWASRLGTYPTYREDAIKLMQWGVTVLFVLAVGLAITQFVQNHAGLATFLFGIGISIILGWFILTVATAKPKEDDDH